MKLFWATTSHGLKGPIKTNGQIMDKRRYYNYSKSSIYLFCYNLNFEFDLNQIIPLINFAIKSNMVSNERVSLYLNIDVVCYRKEQIKSGLTHVYI